MAIWQKLVWLFAAFSGVFYLFRTSNFYDSRILLANLGGIPWLYSVIGTIFGVIAAFVIQKEWERWNSLVDAVKGEAEAVGELWLWSRHFSPKLRKHIEKTIISYLEAVMKEGLWSGGKEEKSEEAESALSGLHDSLYEVFEDNPELMPSSFTMFSDILSKRSERFHHASHKMPSVLRNVLVFAMTLLIVLSFFIGIESVFLDYLFTASIAMLSFAVFMVVDDMDHPLAPGGWHLSPRNYENLLTKIKTNKSSG